MGSSQSKKRSEAWVRYSSALRQLVGGPVTPDGYKQIESSQGAEKQSLLRGRAYGTYSEGLDKVQNDPLTKDEKLDLTQQDPEEEEEVGFPVCRQVSLRVPSYKDLIDFSHFIKEKGGLGGIYYSRRREEILDLYAENEWGFEPGWQQYTTGPGTRYPKTFGFLFKLEPVSRAIGDEYAANNHLLHSSQLCPQEDPEGETLMWSGTLILPMTLQH
ncbi:nef protein [Simian immunodeficiency virus]|uniref:Protein Nef n=2 Tax=Simian immunodeficiency virus TaxID=11723 RepID=NEF_SIVGB|nr:RecName: Full=Protein Nef; AltName: Full=3'ORF; AltName: Full=Negative factor; Short=F-protein [Simian immunodeficiency virus (ISOLATE GB1)]pir/S28085/ nef protein - simian immunodeficiency virus [Simian immunodeficiency virus]AAB49575.1 nef protein [Simian immunodeficiency virus]